MTRTIQSSKRNRDRFAHVWPWHALLGLSLGCSSDALPLNEVDESTTGGGSGEIATVTTAGTSDGSGGSVSDAGDDGATAGTSGGGEILYPPAGGGEPHISGELDGIAIDIQGTEGVLGSGRASSANLGGWITSVATGDAATVYLWSDGESTQGLLEIAPAEPGVLEWVCLDDVQISADETGWSSSKLSRLGSCDSEGGLPLEFSFSPSGRDVQGSFRGEPIDWSHYSSAQSAGFSQFFFGLDAGQQAELDLYLRDDPNGSADGEYDVASARLVIVSGEGAAACGGSGVITSQRDSVSINIDEFSALRSCPGEAADGQLSGGL